jgi:hypothetical protein
MCLCCACLVPCPQYAKIVQKLGFQATFKEFKIQNIVGSCDVRFPIRLEGLAFAHSLFASVSGQAGGNPDERPGTAASHRCNEDCPGLAHPGQLLG